MRGVALLALIGLGLALLGLLGCDDDDNFTQVTVSGTVTNQGVPQGNATLVLLQNGVPVSGQVQTNAQGQYTFTNVTPGTYVIQVTNNGVTTLSGPITVGANSLSNVDIEAPTTANLPAGVVLPNNGTATLVVSAVDANGNAIPQLTVQVNEFTPVTNTPGQLLQVTDIAPGTYSVRVTNTATGTSVTYANVTFTANTVNVIRALITGAATGFTVGGTVTNQGAAQQGAQVVLLQNGVPIRAAITTNAQGAFTFQNVAPGVYTLQVTNNGVTTISGPVEVTNANITNIGIEAPAQNALPAGVIIPDNGTATLVVTAINGQGQDIPQLTVQVNAFTPVVNPVGTLLQVTGIAPGTYNVRVGNAATGAGVLYQNVTFTANTVSVIRAAITGAGQQFQVSGVVQNALSAAPVQNATLTLFQNGVAVINNIQTNALGQFSATVPAGTGYVVRVVSAENVVLWSGPFTVNQNITNAEFDVFTAQQLQDQGIALPTAGNATLVTAIRDAQGNLVAGTVQVDAFIPVTGQVGQFVTNANFAPGTYNVRVTVGAQTFLFQQIPFAADQFVTLDVPVANLGG